MKGKHSTRTRCFNEDDGLEINKNVVLTQNV